MNRTLFAVTLLAGATAIAAQAFALEPYMPRSDKAFARADADSNGKVTAAELTPRANRLLLRYDANNDGAVSVAEIDTALQKALERRRNRLMATLDADKNGAITEAELDNFITAMLNGADTDKDGGVSLEEARNFKLLAWRKTYLTQPGAN